GLPNGLGIFFAPVFVGSEQARNAPIRGSWPNEIGDAFWDWSGPVATPAPLEFKAEPAAGVSPVVVCCRGGNTKHLSGLRDGQTGKEAQLDEFGHALVMLFQLS